LLVPEQIIYDDDIYHTHRILAEGFDTGDDELALVTIADVGPGGHFLAQKHTREHIRDIWISELTHPRSLPGDQPEPDIRRRARAKLDGILVDHEPEPLEDAVQVELKEILKLAEKAFEA
jgi:trimethylamine--corrinoid protein Co-methyltransferase